jgi:hypothetical protein
MSIPLRMTSPCLGSVILARILCYRIEAGENFVALGASKILDPMRTLSGAAGQPVKLVRPSATRTCACRVW